MNPLNQPSDVLRNRATEARERLGGAVQNTRERLEEGVQTHPLRTILISVGAGIVLGMLLGLGKRRRQD